MTADTGSTLRERIARWWNGEAETADAAIEAARPLLPAFRSASPVEAV
jgi:hypothetical protein